MINHIHPQANPAQCASNECTIQMPSGRDCGAKAWHEAPFPICRNHAVKLYMRMRSFEQHAILNVGGEINLRDNEREAELTVRAAANLARSVVYYIRIGDSIKIGYTANLRQRLAALRVNRGDVLATEPGGKTLEGQRHLKFKAIRKGKREDFEPTFALIQHIDSVRERHGDPQFP